MSRDDLWGGRFGQSMDEEMRRFSTSLPCDRRLALQDLAVSRVHARRLQEAGVLNEQQCGELFAALTQIETEARQGRFPVPDTGAPPEDIHSAVEKRLVEICGESGRRLHAGRSRNDQVVTDVLLWLKEASAQVETSVRSVQRALVEQAELHKNVISYLYTHLQRGQPVLLAHHLLAHFEALERDVARLRSARTLADRCPLGAGAGAGSTFKLDREASARQLGFGRVSLHSLDAVADRDWAIEFVGVCALIMTHLSRLAEEIVLWSTQEFGAAQVGDAWCTGSSMMPQKRNPDAAELVRGKTARVHGALVTLHTLLKGLPLAYNRDLQEDKEPLFDAAATTRDCAYVLAQALTTTSFRTPRPAGGEFSCATDLAEELVRRGVPFREAHQRVGRLVASCEASGRGLAEAREEELAAAGLGDLDRVLLTAEGSVKAKQTAGSTAPGEVDMLLRRATERLETTALERPEDGHQ